MEWFIAKNDKSESIIYKKIIAKLTSEDTEVLYNMLVNINVEWEPFRSITENESYARGRFLDEGVPSEVTFNRKRKWFTLVVPENSKFVSWFYNLTEKVIETNETFRSEFSIMHIHEVNNDPTDLRVFAVETEYTQEEKKYLKKKVEEGCDNVILFAYLSAFIPKERSIPLSIDD
jgi:hypothetical protein